MAPTTIQSRIDAFEALSSSSSPSRRLSRPSSPPASLIDLHDWVLDDGLPAPPLPPPPPLPPRKPSLDTHTYPPLTPDPAPLSPRHAAASSISSFQSVSLDDPDSASLAESSEQASTPSILALPPPPRLPARRAPPPPPPPPTDRPSTSSPSHLKVKRPTPVPHAARLRYDAVFDANVRQHRRADAQKAVQRPALLSPEQARGTHRRAAGWRGLSVDLITAAQDAPADDDAVGPSDKLEGRFVKPIWRRSRLGRKTLAEIWNECDPLRTGSLTRDQFAKGMWRIDEELRRAQVQALKPASLRSPFKPPPPVPKNKPILR
ncbi:hypothetical protein C0992_009661 [Termitomyces sp. T32_za158]|nr:hypothetical protein C0992_009661 [Termitomyces sp. T32_za158]